MSDVVRALSIAGSDPSGGAGIQADLKTFSALGAYGMAALTSLTAQNTRGVTGVHTPPAVFLTAQLDALTADITIDAVKIGMVADADVARAVAAWLRDHRPPVVVLDPVMVATSGDRLLAESAVAVVRDELVPLADLVTPNLPELAVLVGREPATTWAEALAQGRRLAERAEVAVLVKGGHLGGDGSPDALVDPGSGPGATLTVVELTGPRVSTRHTHGTGCSLSSALAALRPGSSGWEQAARAAKAWLTGALAAADRLGVGGGHGPVHHFHALWPEPGGPSRGVPPVPGETFTGAVWRRTASLRAGIDKLPFVRGLADGSLSADRFGYYLRQDAIYLGGYSRALARCSALAPGPQQQLRWAASAHSALAVEATLHEDWLAASGQPRPDPAESSPTTAGYLDHLAAVAGGGEYAELVAAVLPCFWVYSDVGTRLHAEAAGRADHPFRRWIDTYADQEFAEATAWVVAEADRCAAEAGPALRARMAAAFERSVRYEWMFWDAAWQRQRWPI